MDLTVLILTYNEEQHIERCIKSLQSFARDIFIIDSFSTDKTVQLAESLGAKIFQNVWLNNHAIQFNWGLENCPIQTKWVMRMDADEYITDELAKEIQQKIPLLPDDVTGIYMKRRTYFMNKWMKYGGHYPIWLLRIWQNKKASCEERWMDEHMKIIEGKSIKFDNDFVDHNLHGLTAWIAKHNNYATREVVDMLNGIYQFQKCDDIEPDLFGSQEQRKRSLKTIYYRLPLFFRPFIYFNYVYIFRLGFLDGKAGFLLNFLSAFWYRFLIDAKLDEVYLKTNKNKDEILKLLKNEYKIDLHKAK